MSSITYRDGRFLRDGVPLFFVGVEYQYYRDRRDAWAERLDQIAAAHANVICFYVPWRHHVVHDPATGAVSYDFDGATLDSRDLRTFLSLCEERGLYMLAKPGPFVHSELNIGGLPDIASPSFNRGIEPCRVHDGRPLYWEYDHSLMPAPDDPGYDEAVRHWLAAAGEVLRPHAHPAGGIIAVQLNDETLYCTSNDAPWHFGYDAPSVRRFHAMLAEKYGSLAAYNAAHGTAYGSLSFVAPPRLDPSRPAASSVGEVLALADWGEFQWRIRRDAYARYKGYLGIDLPCLTNFAGITPPIAENVPDMKEAPTKDSPPEYLPLYADWWLAQNRVDLDRDVYHYGMISWLGVAAYNVQDASSDPPADVGGNEVFHRYVATARRRRGVNVEENWGFSKLYHPLSKHPVICFFQTLASVAGGCTGYVVFTGVNHAYWPDDLDRVTRLQHPTFPDAAPIGEHGETGPMYDAMSLLNGWFAAEGSALLRAEPEIDCRLLSIPEWAAVSSWVPSDADWSVPGHAVPRAGTGAIEPAVRVFNRAGVGYGIAELAALSAAELAATPISAIRLAFFMAEADQRKLVGYVRGGGTLLACGEPPALDDRMRPCTVLADFLATRPAGVVWGDPDLLADEAALVAALRRAGWSPRVTYPDGTCALVHRAPAAAAGGAAAGPGDDDLFVFFFEFARGGPNVRTIEVHGRRLDLVTGPKTCGAVRVRGDRLVSWLVKGVNEYEGVAAEVRIRWAGGDEVVVHGDGSGSRGG
jgi:beta-galactosidase